MRRRSPASDLSGLERGGNAVRPAPRRSTGLSASGGSTRRTGHAFKPRAQASPATRVGDSAVKRTRTAQSVVSVCTAHVHVYTQTHMRHGGRPASTSHECPTHGTLPPGRARVAHPTVSLRLGIIRSWGAFLPARIRSVTSCFAQVAQECAVIPGVRLYMHKSIGLGLSWLGLRRSWTRATSSVPSAGIPGTPAATTAGVFARSGGRRGELIGQASPDSLDRALSQIARDLTSCVHPECDALWMHR